MIARKKTISSLYEAIQDRILILDGAMGTLIQKKFLEEEDFRGKKFINHPIDVKGNNDLLILTQPEIIKDIHKAYLDAGADIICTNTFNSTRLSQADYQMGNLVHDLNYEGAKLACLAVEEAEKFHKRPCFVAGVLGPTSKTASISPDINRPEYREVTFDQLVANYEEATRALIKGGVSLLLVETIFDTINAKAAIFAIENVFSELEIRLPIMISVTITDLSGRTLSGQTVEAFCCSLQHATPFSIGLNCALGPKELDPYVFDLSKVSEHFISVHPNAGLPNEFGEYDETPEQMASYVLDWAKRGLINIVGGCCGTTPEHIRKIKEVTESIPPRDIPKIKPALRLSGLELFEVVA